MDDLKRIPIITLWLPWCFWIALGWKTIESRSHDRFSSLKGKTIGIHVGKKWDETALDQAKEYLSKIKNYINPVDHTEMIRENNIKSCIICTAYVEGFRELKKEDSQKALIDCEHTKRYGLLLSDVKSLDKWIHVKGHQGIWYIKDV